MVGYNPRNDWRGPSASGAQPRSSYVVSANIAPSNTNAQPSSSNTVSTQNVVATTGTPPINSNVPTSSKSGDQLKCCQTSSKSTSASSTRAKAPSVTRDDLKVAFEDVGYPLDDPQVLNKLCGFCALYKMDEDLVAIEYHNFSI